MLNSESPNKESPTIPVLPTAVSLNTLLLALVCGVITACGDVEHIKHPLATLKVRSQLAEVIPVATALKTLPEEVEVILQPEPTTPPVTDADPVLEQVVLDLNLSAEILATGDDGVSTLQLNMNRLPDLFEQSEKEARTSFYVELLRNENIPHVTKNIDGLNLTIEHRLGG